MSLIIEILPWGREAVRESIVGVGALVGIDAGQPSDHRLVDVAGAASPPCPPRERNWAAGVLLRGYALTCFPSPARLLPGKLWHFAYSVPGVMCCVLSRNWSPDIRFDLGSPCHATIFITGTDHRYSRMTSARCLRMPPWQGSMPGRSRSNWREAANRPMLRSWSQKAASICSKFHCLNGATRTGPCSAPPASLDVSLSSPAR